VGEIVNTENTIATTNLYIQFQNELNSENAQLLLRKSRKKIQKYLLIFGIMYVVTAVTVLPAYSGFLVYLLAEELSLLGFFIGSTLRELFNSPIWFGLNFLVFWVGAFGLLHTISLSFKHNKMIKMYKDRFETE